MSDNLQTVEPDYEFEAFTRTKATVFHNDNVLNLYVTDIDSMVSIGVPFDAEEAMKLRDSIDKWIGDKS